MRKKIIFSKINEDSTNEITKDIIDKILKESNKESDNRKKVVDCPKCLSKNSAKFFKKVENEIMTFDLFKCEKCGESFIISFENDALD